MNKKSDTSLPVPPWVCATAADLEGLDFEAPIVGEISADCHELCDLFHDAVQKADDSKQLVDTPAARIFTTLSAVTGLHFRPDDRNEPFGPMWVFADGRRSAVLSDFRGHLDLLGAMAERAINPVLCARLADVCWVLDRKRGGLATIAISAYADIVQKTDLGELQYRFATDKGALQPKARDYLLRALQIGRATGWDKPETMTARNLADFLRKKAIAKQLLFPIDWFCDLDLDFTISDPVSIGGSIEKVLSAVPEGADMHIIVALWRLSARAYHLGKKEDDKNRCLFEAVECLVAEAEAKQGSAMLASHFLSSAIAQLHGIPGKKERRTQLLHKLGDIQSRIPEEMSTFSQEIDLREITEKIQEVAGRGTLLDKLFVFVALANSPNPDQLISDAKEAIKKTHSHRCLVHRIMIVRAR